MSFLFSLKKLLLISLSISILFSGIGCKNNTEQPTKPKVVGQKIRMDAAEHQKLDDSEKFYTQESSSLEKVEAEKKISHLDINIAESSRIITDENEFIPEPDLQKVMGIYNPEQKIDPFLSLIKDEPRPEVNIVRKDEREKRIPRTPLERIDLSQLKLVGIIQLAGGNKGLVEEASGKGYIISTGTYMGNDGGRVVEIAKDRIIVEEEVDDILGKLTLQRKELKLQKPFGEN